MLDETSPNPTPETPEAPAARPRRRAASRPAGPPADVTAERPAATEPAKAPAKKATVKKAAAKAPAKTTAAKPTKAPAKKATAKKAAPAGEAAVEAAVEAPSTPPTRKRAAKKSAVQPPAAPSAGAGAESDQGGSVQVAVPVLFQAPDPTTPTTPARTRSRSRKATAATPEVAPEQDVATAAAAEVAETDAGEPGDAGEADRPEGEGGRRRRRRGGRGRRGRTRAEGEGDSDESAEGGSPEHGEAAGEAEPGAESQRADDEDEGEGDGGSTRRRRRRRSRGGANGEPAADDPDRTVTRVRQPRARAESGPTAIKGSTRLEAKKQRRRDGRDSGRRRPPIITEAEFLARRESVDRAMVVRQSPDRTQIAVLEDGVLVEHYVDRAGSNSMVGSVFLGKVQNVLPSMEAAFVDIGRGRNAVLYAGEVNWDAAGLDGQPRRIEHALKSGAAVLVQVTKDPIGHKGSRLTAQISLPGRFLVYVPDGSMTGISRKLPEGERTRLKAILKKVVPDDAGVIVRTAAEGASEEELAQDVARLQEQWESIESKAKSVAAPALLYGEPDLTVKVVRDLFNEDFARVVVQGDEAWATIEEYVSRVAPDLLPRILRHTGDRDIFAEHRVDEQIAKALDRKVFLPSGGSLVIDRTEAMTVVDVNTGKFTGQGGNLEETVTKNNLEAAEEVVRQLRLRDIGGIIVVDFIDMVLESNRDLVLRRLTECLGRDRTKHQVAEVTSLGLVQMTRKRIGTGLLEAFSETCQSCGGRGVHVHSEPVEPKSVRAEHVEERSSRRGKGDSGDEGEGGGKKSGRSRKSAKTAADPVVEDPEAAAKARQLAEAAAAAMEKIHRAARLAEEEAASGAAVSEPAVSEPAVSEPDAPQAPAPVKRARRRAVRPAGPAAPSAPAEG